MAQAHTEVHTEGHTQKTSVVYGHILFAVAGMGNADTL